MAHNWQDVYILIDAWLKDLCHASTWLMLDSYSALNSKNDSHVTHFGQDVYSLMLDSKSYAMLLLDWLLTRNI